MVKKALRPAFDPSDTPMDQLVKLSRWLGSDPEFVIAGGGNTSLKTDDRLFVKASGTSLSSIDAGGFVEMARAPLGRLLEQDLDPDPDAREARFKQAILAARIYPDRGQRPSVECVLHNLIPRRFVVHAHTTLVNVIACCRGGEALAGEIFGERILWIPYVNPGFTLAKNLNRSLAEYAERTGRDSPSAVLLQNHGSIVCGETPDEVLENTDWVVQRVEEYLQGIPSCDAFGPVRRIEPEQARAWINILGPALRALLADGERLKVAAFDDSDLVLSIAGGEQGRSAALGGPLTPDQIVYCQSFPLWFEPEAHEEATALISRLSNAIGLHRRTKGLAPLVILVRGLGLFAAGDDFAQADTVRRVYTDAIKVMSGARRLGGICALGKQERDFIEQWEVEAYRRQVAVGDKRPGKATGLVAVVTGAAQGFGLEIARDLAAEGAHVVLCDINEEGAKTQAEQLSARWGTGRAKASSMNVTESQSISEAIHQVVRSYGGFDLLVSNAGVLRAGSVKSQPEAEFDLVAEVNYKGYFLVVQNAAPIMALQHQARPDYWSDIIQINSKSGLSGSNRNAAYAGSKFGGIGLTQSFALELIEDGIKVNAVCPGNYFDGPLWSDPETGLFVQYLRTGKVPGARTIADVRRYYEAKVPMGRGCTTSDVMNAVYYLISQKYETGQALPVTGGQIMLS
jgi:rhamnose utilization protein RhaD (predicted bifunctional aldolase and dehydrogenase)/NAD(P)-dependent dehydrogenase (short-subunit alcohol dehydrogenase family)